MASSARSGWLEPGARHSFLKESLRRCCTHACTHDQNRTRSPANKFKSAPKNGKRKTQKARSLRGSNPPPTVLSALGPGRFCQPLPWPCWTSTSHSTPHSLHSPRCLRHQRVEALSFLCSAIRSPLRKHPSPSPSPTYPSPLPLPTRPAVPTVAPVVSEASARPALSRPSDGLGGT